MGVSACTLQDPSAVILWVSCIRKCLVAKWFSSKMCWFWWQSPWPRSSDWNPPWECALKMVKGQVGSVAQAGVKPGLPGTVGRDAGFCSHLLRCRFTWILMREDISSLGLHFQSRLALKVCSLQAVTHEELWKAQSWSSTVIPPLVHCVLLLHRWELCKSH